MTARLEVVLGPPGPVSFGRRARGPSVELDPGIGAQAQIQGAQEARRRGDLGRTRARATRSAGPDAALFRRIRRLTATRRAGVTLSMRRQFTLEAQQLLHEVEVRRYIGLATADQIERVVQVEAALVHQVGHGYRDRARYAGQTVHQHTFVRAARLLCKRAKNTLSMLFSFFLLYYCLFI